MKWMLNCQENTQLVTKSLDQRLTLIDRLQVKMHLAMCSTCRRYAKQIQWLDTAFRKRNSTQQLSPEDINNLYLKLTQKINAPSDENPDSTRKS